MLLDVIDCDLTARLRHRRWHRLQHRREVSLGVSGEMWRNNVMVFHHRGQDVRIDGIHAVI